MRSRLLSAVVLVFGAAAASLAQSPAYGVGRTPTLEEIRSWDIAVGPAGLELPAGRGTAVDGRQVYDTSCARCHGATGTEGPNDVLKGGAGTLTAGEPLKTVGSYWSHATTLWDYVNRAMPFDRPMTLPADQVYGAVAYVLFINGIIGEKDVLDRTTLPRIRMPNRDAFTPDPRPDVGQPNPAARATAGKRP